MHIILFFLFFFSFFNFFFFIAAINIPKEPKIAAGLTVATTPTSAIPVAPTPMGPGNFLPLVLSSIKAFIIKSIPSFCLFLVNSCCALYFFSGSTFVEVALTSQFEVGSSSTTVPDLASEAASFFARFDLPETNDLDPSDFCGARAPYMDFHGFWVLGECITYLEEIYNSCRDFKQGFLFGRFAREHFLKLLGSVMNNIKHSFIDTVFAERILQWRVVV